MGACAGGPDSAGYLLNARLLSRGEVRGAIRALPEPPPDSLPAYTYVPLGFNPAGDGRTMLPVYPMGLPLLIAGAAGLVGWSWAPGVVLGLHALAGLGLVLALARAAGLEAPWSLGPVLLLAASPLYLFLSVQALSDVPALVWTTAAVLAAWQSRARPALALASGLALSLAVLVRPTNLLAFLPVGLALGLGARRWLALLLGGLPGAAFWALVNRAAYGHVLATGYGYMADHFGLAYLPVTLLHFLTWLPVLLTPLVLLAAGLPWVRRCPPRLPAVLATWALAYLGIYAVYVHTHETWWYLRFVLPAFPPLAVAAVLVARELAARFARPRPGWWLAAAAAGIVACGGLGTRHLHANRGGRYERVYPALAAWLQQHLPANAVVAAMQASGALDYYGPFVVFRWDVLQPEDFRRLGAACDAAGRPVYAVLFEFEREGDHRARFDHSLGTGWTPIGAVDQAAIWRREPAAAAGPDPVPRINRNP